LGAGGGSSRHVTRRFSFGWDWDRNHEQLNGELRRKRPLPNYLVTRAMKNYSPKGMTDERFYKERHRLNVLGISDRVSMEDVQIRSRWLDKKEVHPNHVKQMEELHRLQFGMLRPRE
jgi:hypothetical protein